MSNINQLFHLAPINNLLLFILKLKFPLKMKRRKNLRRRECKCIVSMPNLKLDPSLLREEE